MIKLYWINSPYSIRVKASLLTKWLLFWLISVDLRNKSNDFLSLNPLWKIPVLEDDDWTIVFESVNIANYLDAKYPQISFCWENLKQRVEIFNLVWLCDWINWFLTPFFLDKYWMKKISEEDKQTNIWKINNLLVYLENKLSSNTYLIWNKFTFADASLLWTLYFTDAFWLINSKILLNWFEINKKDEKISKIFPSESDNIIWNI